MKRQPDKAHRKHLRRSGSIFCGALVSYAEEFTEERDSVTCTRCLLLLKSEQERTKIVKWLNEE